MEREVYPLDVHSEISLSSKSKTDGKGFLIKLILFGVVVLFAIGGNLALSYFEIPFMGFIAGLLIGIWISMLIWNKFMEREEALIENPEENKTMKFFKLTLGRGDFIGDVPVIEYTNGDKAIILSLSLGNQTTVGRGLVVDFLDILFSTCHKNRIKFKIFTTIEEWEDSDVYDRLLKVYGKVHDERLRAAMFESISVQSEDFAKSKILQMNFIFIDRDYELHKLKTVIDYVESFREGALKLSSLRSLRWNSQERTVRLFCRFLGIKLIDSSPLADKSQVYLDTKALVRPFNPDNFFSSPKLTSHLTNTLAKRVRVPITYSKKSSNSD